MNKKLYLSSLVCILFSIYFIENNDIFFAAGFVITTITFIVLAKYKQLNN